jgi:chitin synthase
MFHFLMSGLTDDRFTDPFYGKGMGMDITMKQLYLFSIIMIFIASLGNRPQGSRIMYTGSFLLFAIIMCIMSYVSGFYIHLAISDVISRSRLPDGSISGTTLGRLFAEERAFRDLVLSLSSTFLVYLIASLLCGDPWHMITSFVQYMLLVPSFVNILMVYAFCNLHDISWGTKGQTGTTESAPVTVQQDPSGTAMATMHLPVDQTDIDETYSWFFRRMKDNPPSPPRQDTKEDYFRLFRTRLVLVWILSNTLLVVTFTTPSVMRSLGVQDEDFNPFISFYLWSVAAMAFIRFCGSVGYRVSRLRGMRYASTM